MKSSLECPIRPDTVTEYLLSQAGIIGQKDNREIKTQNLNKG